MTSLHQSRDIERIAETHSFIRKQIVNALGAYVINPEVRHILGGFSTYGDYWTATLGDRFFDMSTLQRLATAVEVALREFHRATSPPGSPNPKRGLFQQLVKPNDLAATLLADCRYDISSNPTWRRMQILMAHRHLYAHRSGLVDDEYIQQINDLTGNDIRPKLAASGYPDEEVYWFTPLRELSKFIEEARTFVANLPWPPSATHELPPPSVASAP